MPYPFSAELVVESYLHGVRIDSFLNKHFRNYTQYRLQRMVRAGQAAIEGVTAEPDDRVFRGQTVQVRLIEPPDHLLPAEPLPLEVLYEDAWLIVVNKPPGQVCHPCGFYTEHSLANALQHHFDGQTPLKGLLRPGIVHRLDRQTSGVIVCTKDHLAHRKLSISFQSGRVSKTYLALVYGELRDDEGTINLPLGQIAGGESILMSAQPDAIDPRPARTLYRVLDRFAGYSFVRAHPLTGRFHQIRVHLAALGHPVLADEFYSPQGPLWEQAASPAHAGDAANGTGVQPPLRLERHALHANTLEFIHPITGKTLSLTAPLAADMQAVLDGLRHAATPQAK